MLRWKMLWMGLLLVAPLAAAPAFAARAEAAARVGVCPVCKVREGEAEEEPVKAVRVYAGKEYGFCSEKCAKEFDADPVAYLPPEFPRTAPAYALVGLDGKPITPASLKGKVVLLDFWATWCVPCKKSMPDLQALHEKYGKRGFVVVGISIDEDGPSKVRKYVAAKKFTYPIAVDSEKNPAWESFKVKAIPAAFLIDGQGRIVEQWTGIAASREEIEAKLEKLLVES